jgi:hypothetical protein
VSDERKDLLPELDREFLEEKGYDYRVEERVGALHLIFPNYPLPAAYTPRTSDLMIIVPAGYPNANPDMYWTYPDVKLATGGWPQAGDQHVMYGDRNWQRWSRHLNQIPWRPGVDNLRTYLATVRKDIAKGI